MNYPANVVSIHPYFKVHPGQLGAFKAGLPAFIEKTRTEGPLAQMNPAWFILEAGLRR